MDCIPLMYYGSLVGVPFRGDDGSYRFTLVHLDQLGFYALDGIMGEIGLPLAGWDGRTRRTGWNRGGMEGPALSGAGSGEPPLVLEVQPSAGKRRLSPISSVLQGAQSICVSAAK